MKKFPIWLIPLIMVIVIPVVFVLISRSIEWKRVDEVPLGGYGGSSVSESIITFVTSSSGKTIYDGAVYLERVIVGLNSIFNDWYFSFYSS